MSNLENMSPEIRTAVRKNLSPGVEMSEAVEKPKLISKPKAEEMTASAEPDFYGEYEELYDPDVMEIILRDSLYSDDIRKALRAYKKGAGKGCGARVNVKYYYGKNCGALKIGRVFAKARSGLQSFPRDVRDPLTAKWYWDLDMENAHYWIMRNFCENNGLRCDKIAYYCDHREECLEVVSADRGIAKLAFLRIAYGGNIKLADIHFEDSGEEPEGDIGFIKSIEKEIDTVVKYVKGSYPEELKRATEMCKRKKEWADKKGKKIYWNIDYTALSLVLQTQEHKCLEVIEKVLIENNRQLDIPIHDGGRVRKLENETKFPEDTIRTAQEKVRAELNYTIKLKIKPLPTFQAPPRTGDVIDDEYASRRFVELMEDYIVREEDTIYYFNPDTGMWETGKTAFLTAVSRHKHKLIFKSVNEKGEEKVFNYGGTLKNILAMEKFIPTCLPNSRKISDSMDSSQYKLLFQDGIFDFNTGFTVGFDPAIVFTKRINRKFPTVRDEKLIRLVDETLFQNAFDDVEAERHAGLYFKKCLCVGLVGDYRRKKFNACLGESNCGKGLTTTAFTKAFEGYIDEWDANELKYSSRNGQDEARKLAWLKKLQGVRIGFSNEFRMDRTPIDGNLLKKASSGGDTLKGRDHQEGAISFINRCMLFLMGNDFGNITPKDSGIKERCRFIRFTKKFVDGEPSAPDERKKVPEAKDWFNEDRYKDALFFTMCDCWNMMSLDEKKINGKIIEPECVMEETNEWVGDNGDDNFNDYIRRRYEITGSADDSVPSAEIVEYIQNECKLSALSPNKIGRNLTKLIQSVNKDCPRDRCALGDEVGKQRQGLRNKNTKCVS
jgi:hypothetical protein